MKKYIGKGVANDFYNALQDARSSFSAEEIQEYAPETIEEMFQVQLNVNIRAAAEMHSNAGNPKTATVLLDFANYDFPDYREIFNVKDSVRLGQGIAKIVKRTLSDIRHLPALENEEPFDPNPWPDYNEMFGAAEAARQGSAAVASLRNLLAAVAKIPVPQNVTGDKQAWAEFTNTLGLKKLADSKSTETSPASDKDRRQPDGPQMA
ncbi:MAG: hypothetical protein JWO78_372 [Micavibrio sp.]|nr:hypothetical protein [Micavibrio sp.]